MNTNNRFKDYVVLIFGGTSGIGLATAIEFINEGASVVIISGRSEGKWSRAKEKINEYCDKKIVSVEENIINFEDSILEYAPCDVRLSDNVKNLIELVIEKYKNINVYFNNAGVQPVWGDGDGDDITKLNLESYVDTDGSIIYRIPPPQPSSENTLIDPNTKNCSTPTSIFCENPIATSAIGMFYCLKWEMHYVFQQESDIPVSIINTSSRNGINIPSDSRPLYAASKAFIHSLTQTIATQAAKKGLLHKRSVRVNCIAPGPILTALEIPLFVETNDPFKELSEEEMNEFNSKGKIGVPLGRTGLTSEITPTVLFLADPRQSSYITGATISIDGGYTASPVF